MERMCKVCGCNKDESEFPITGKHKRKDGGHTTLYKPECKSCFNDKLKQQIKEKLDACGVEWKCVRCGYDRSIAALDMHHLDPTHKEFAIYSRWSISVDRLKDEVKKCIVLCSNCHRELHAGDWAVS